jgi:hypothetical protein
MQKGRLLKLLASQGYSVLRYPFIDEAVHSTCAVSVFQHK